jgi:hypothetical protein
MDNNGRLHADDLLEACENCGGNFNEHVLVAGPPGEADYYECIETVLTRQAELGNDVACAAMARIQNVQERAGARGSMSADNAPSFVEDPGNVRWRETLGKGD